MAFQVAFDLFENDAPEFLVSVGEMLQADPAPAPAAAAEGDAMETGDAPSVDATVSTRRGTLRRILSGATPCSRCPGWRCTRPAQRCGAPPYRTG